jgi:hypothetical protein
MAVKLASIFVPQFFDSSGNPLSGGKLFTYAAGSTTKQTTYKDSGGLNAHANPIILDSSGYPSASGSVQEIWLTSGVSYKFVLAPSTDSDPPTSPIYTADNLSGINDTTVSIDEWIAGPTPTYVGATQFTLAGDQTGTFTVGRRIKATVTAGTAYGRITASVFGASTTVTVQCDGSQALDSGLSAVSYGLLASSVLSIPNRVATTSGTDTYTASVGISRLVIGDEYKVKIGTTNTITNPTLNLDSTGAKTIVRPDGSALFAGELSGEHTFRWNGTNHIVLNPELLTSKQTANTVFAGPSSGAAAAPTFRALTAADGGPLVLLDTKTASTSATLDFVTGIGSTYDEYELHLVEFIPVTNSVTLELRVSEDGGSTFKAGATDYHVAVSSVNGAGTAATASGAQTALFLNGGTGGNGQRNAATSGLSGVIKFWKPSGTTNEKNFDGRTSCEEATTTEYLRSEVGGRYQGTTNAINAIRLLYNSGNIASGTAYLYGVRKT